MGLARIYDSLLISNGSSWKISASLRAEESHKTCASLYCSFSGEEPQRWLWESWRGPIDFNLVFIRFPWFLWSFDESMPKSSFIDCFTHRDILYIH